MMKMILMAGAAMLMATPACAQGVELWKGVRAGMTVEEVQTVLAGHGYKVEVRKQLMMPRVVAVDDIGIGDPSDNCTLELTIPISKKTGAEQVQMTAYGCASIVLKSLRAKYGEPDFKDYKTEFFTAGPRLYSYTGWLRDGVKIMLRLDEDGNGGTVSYRVYEPTPVSNAF